MDNKGGGSEDERETGKPGPSHNGRTDRLSRFSESRIPNRSARKFLSTPLNRKPDARGPFACTTTILSAASVTSTSTCASVYSRLCHAEYHLPYRGVYYAALNPAIHMGCRRTQSLSTNVTRRGFLNLGLLSPCSETHSRDYAEDSGRSNDEYFVIKTEKISLGRRDRC